ncbi:ABC transporter substrate-binding protein [soil metagenome]
MNEPLVNLDGGTPHPAARDLLAQLRRGEIGRRDFLRVASWLGISGASAAGAAGLAACAPVATPVTRDTLRFVCAVQQMTDPALTTWIEASNLFRNCLEFLVEVDADNITRPFLAQSWRPSEDLKTWDFVLRPGVSWSNGEPFGVEDVAFNIRRWIAPDSKSVNRTAFSALTGFEATGPLSFRLHLDRPICSLPEQLYAFTCPILHRDFDKTGADWPKAPVGTGPFRMTDFQVGRQASFVRREDYWGPKPALARIDYIDLGTDISTHVAALAAGQVDILYRVSVAELDLVDRLPQARLIKQQAAQTVVMRMQHDQKPFDDVRVRRAVQLAADNAQMLALAYRGHGVVGENHHVAPFQPDYGALPPQRRDVPQARALLDQAGHPDGIDLTLTLGNTQGRFEQDTAQVLQQNLAQAGIRLKLNVLPASEYWSVWDKTPFGLTYWSHRPLGVMALDLAYRSTSAWNESHFNNPAFDAGLDLAMSLIDPKARAGAMSGLEKILQDQAVMVQPYWAEKFTAVSPRVRGYRAHPSDYFRMDKVWLADA